MDFGFGRTITMLEEDNNMQTKLLINGQLVNGEGPAQPVLNPSLGAVLVEINEATKPRSTPPCVPPIMLSMLVANRAERPLAAAAETRRRHRSPRRRTGQTRIRQLRQTLQRCAQRRDSGDCRRVPFLRRRQPLHERFGRWRIPARPHLDDPSRSGRRDRLHRAVELPADDGRLENRPGAGRR
jgi:hypothetical protein